MLPGQILSEVLRFRQEAGNVPSQEKPTQHATLQGLDASRHGWKDTGRPNKGQGMIQPQ